MTLLITLAEGEKAWSSQTPTSSAFSSSDVLFSQRSSCTLILCVLSGLSSAMWTINTAHCSPANGVAEGQEGKLSSSSERHLENRPRKGLSLTQLEDLWHHSTHTRTVSSQPRRAPRGIFSVEDDFWVSILFKSSLVMFEKSSLPCYLASGAVDVEHCQRVFWLCERQWQSKAQK